MYSYSKLQSNILSFLRRFQKKPNSPSTTITTTNVNVVTSSTNQRKRTAPETTVKETPSPKRLSNPSSSNVQINSSASIGNKNPVEQAEKSVVKTTSERPRFVPQLITPPSTRKSPRIRQPPSVVIKRSSLPATTSSSSNIEDENQLLEPTDVVDTFALIDEALREADHLLEII